jgi:hypothetical protein
MREKQKDASKNNQRRDGNKPWPVASHLMLK